MWSKILGFFGGIGLKTWAYLAAFFALLAALAKVYLAGKNAARVEGLENQLDNVKVRNDVENQVRRAGPDAVHDELRDKWTRD